MNRARALAAALAALLAVAPAAAQQQPRPAAQPAQPAAAQADPDALVDATFRAWDTDQDGALSPAEFRAGWGDIRERAEAKVEARLREQFDRVDANDNGGIDAGEYPNLLLVREAAKAGKPVPSLATFDANKDQRLQFDEYLKLVAHMAAGAARAQAGKAP